MARVTQLQVNGTSYKIDVAGARPLLGVLRDELGLTGSKFGCGEGQCGACTVLIDGQATFACITPVETVSDRAIVTIEGLEQEGKLHPLQQAFLEEDALQCGYCTSGMIMAGVALLSKNSAPSRAEIVQGMNRNLCRCCVYPRIIAAVERAAHSMRSPA